MKAGKRQSRRVKRGMVLPLVISIGVILAIIGMGLIQMGYGSRLMSIVTNADISGRAAADGGVTEALFRLNQALPFGGPFTPPWPLPFTSDDFSLTYSNARYNYDISAESTHPVTGRRFWYINSRGRSGRGRTKTVHATTSIYTAWFGIGVQRTVTIHSSPSNPVTFYSYPPDSGIAGRIRTNRSTHNSVWVGPNSDIHGEVLAGPDAVPTAVYVGPGSSVTSIGTAPDRLSFPPATLPPIASWTNIAQLTATDFLNVTDEVELVPITRYTLGVPGTSSAYQITDFDIFKVGGAAVAWTEVSVQGNVIVYAVDAMDILNRCKLVVEPGSTLELYLGGRLTAHNGSELLNENGPLMIPVDLPGTMALQIYGMPTCDRILLQNGGEMWAVLYAPSADLQIDSSAIFYGSFIGGSLDLKNSAGLYYDTRLWDLQDQGPSYFAIERWWEETGTLAGTP